VKAILTSTQHQAVLYQGRKGEDVQEVGEQEQFSVSQPRAKNTANAKNTSSSESGCESERNCQSKHARPRASARAEKKHGYWIIRVTIRVR
jgi:hypothetical protein